MTGEKQTTLTAQELQAAYLTPHDLGPGYPQLDVPDYVHRLYLDSTADDISVRFPPAWTPEKQARVDAGLEFAVRQFLTIPNTPALQIRASFSGSIALDRALSAAQLIARKDGPRLMTVVTTTPSIDIMRHFLEERADVRPVFVEPSSREELGVLNTDRLISAIKAAHAAKKPNAIAVLLCSPENPTGATWDRAALNEIANACAEVDATLIMDHCFAVAGIHAPEDVARIWDLGEGICRWVAVWDTGKTFGLNEDKLGFLISADSQMNKAIDTSVGVLQFGVPRRAKLFFSELMQKASLFDHVAHLRMLCRTNRDALASLADTAKGAAISLVKTRAGSLALIDIHATRLTDEEVRSKLLANGVGVVSGNVFFHTDWKPNRYIRVALARRADYFEEAIDKLWRAINH